MKSALLTAQNAALIFCKQPLFNAFAIFVSTKQR